MGKQFTVSEKAEIERLNKAGISHGEIGEHLG